MSRIVDEVLRTRKACAAEFGKKDKLAVSPARRLGVLTRAGARLDSGKVGGSGRCGRDPQRPRTRDRRCYPLARDFRQTTGNERVVRHPPCQLRRGVVHQRGDERPRNRCAQPQRLRRMGPGSSEGEYLLWLTIKDHPQNLGDVTIRRLNQVVV